MTSNDTEASTLDNTPGGRWFTCKMCQTTYEKAWTDEEAYQETEMYFGVRGDAPNMAIICDDCFNKVHPAQHPEEVKRAKEMK